MIIEKPIPPAPPFKTGKWLLGVIMTTAIVGGIFGALVILFIPEGVFNLGPDTNIRGRGLKEVDARIGQLEERVNKVQPAAGQDLQALQANVNNAVNETRELRQQVATIQTGDKQESRMANIIVGLTQLKTAYENEESLTEGIDRLRSALPEGQIVATLNALSDAAKENFSSKNSLLEQLQQLRKEQNPGQPTQEQLNNKDLTWRERARVAMSQLVKVQPTETIERNDMISQIQQAVSVNDFKQASELAKNLPQSARLSALQSQFDTRMKVQQLVSQATSQISQSLGRQGSLY